MSIAIFTGQSDAIRNIYGQLNQIQSRNDKALISSGALGASYGYSYATNLSGGSNFVFNLLFNAANVVNTDNENRPANAAYPVIIKAL